MSHNRVVVVGGGIGGVSTVASLRAGGYTGEVILVERAEFPYDRPPLSKDYLAGARDLKQIALQPPEWYEEQRVVLIGSAEVTAVNAAHDEVTLSLADGVVLLADHVVLALGGRPARPPIPGSDSSKVFVIRDAEDADALRECLGAVSDRNPRLLVVGGGLIGAETASTARELGAEVVLIDPLDPPLAEAVGDDVARYLHQQHAVNGIETLQTVLESVQENASGITAQLRGENRARHFDAIVLGVGMVPNTALAEEAGLDVDGGILVDEHQVTSHSRVLAVGDCARLCDRRRAEHWEAAQHDGQRAAASIIDGPRPSPTTSWWWSDRHHRHVEGVGEMHTANGTHRTVVRGEIGDAAFCVFTLHEGKVIGAVSVDDSHSVRAARRMIDRGTVVEPATLADPHADLRKLLRG